MEIIKLNLINFRNFSSKNISFDKKLTVIIGPNGSGKSNILEAIAMFAGIRSARIETDLDLIKFQKSEAIIESRIKRATDKDLILKINFLVIDETYIKKGYFIDFFKKRLNDFISNFSIIIFSPIDLSLVTESPQLRRHHMDNILSTCDKQYYRATSAYHKIIIRRNKILQRIAEGRSKISELEFWDERLLNHGKYITQKREEFFNFLNFIEKAMPGGKKGDVSWKITWQLKQSLLTEEKLIKNRERDISAGVTISGPHRDDFRFIFHNKDLAFFGSRGEQRMAVLALKLTELEFLQVQTGSRPILALDDIFSELDWQHRDAVLNVIEKQQTIITAAERESIPKNILKSAKVVELKLY